MTILVITSASLLLLCLLPSHHSSFLSPCLVKIAVETSQNPAQFAANGTWGW
jgi:hypothetical protein